MGWLYSIWQKKLYSVDEGEFRNGLHDGYGQISWENGHHYKGEFFKDKKEGLGVYWFEDGDIYMGSHHDSLFEGYGVALFKDGISLQGMWKNNFMQGTFIKWIDKNEEYLELYKDNELVKSTLITW